MQQQQQYSTNANQPPIQQQPPMPQASGNQPYPHVPPKATKNKFLTFICSLIPGAGQMYFGLYKKGMSLMIAFWGIILLSNLLFMPVITIILPVIWFYSFFESVNRMNMPVEEIKNLKDHYLFADGIETESNGVIKRFLSHSGVLIGVILLGLGLYAFLTSVSNILAYYDFAHMLRSILYRIPSVIIPIICVIIGIKIIVGSNRKSKAGENVENI